MKNEHPRLKNRTQSLDQRLASDPYLTERMHQIADMRDELLAQGCSLDEVEEKVIEQMRLLGKELLGGIAQLKAHQAAEQALGKDSTAQRDSKKKLVWQTTYGTVVIVEEVLRLGRRGPRWRPFCQSAGLQPRALSRALQRALTDFGSEESFARAAARVQEHYGIEVGAGVVRACTLKHGRSILKVAEKMQLPAAAAIITQIDGSLIPVVENASEAEDRRKQKKLFWREVRLCSARPVGKARGLYGATMGSVEVSAALWRETAQRVGLTDRTHEHGVGDGAPWIAEKFKENFPNGCYLLDFYHVSEYLARAALAIGGGKKARSWLRRQQGRLLQNQWRKVLRSLQEHLEPPEADTETTPVRDAYRYISERIDQLDYATAARNAYPIGSGEIESGHRHVVQQRLKLPGAWWSETNAERMLNLRTARSNGLWTHYWNQN